MDIPKCGGYKVWTASGYDYDCDYDCDIICEDCICVTSQHGDMTGIDPTTCKPYNGSDTEQEVDDE